MDEQRIATAQLDLGRSLLRSISAARFSFRPRGGGSFLTADDSDFALARYHADGILDASFGVGGLVTTQIGPAANYGAPFGIKLDKTGKIVAAGECDMGATGIDICVARYKAAEDE